MDPLVLLVASRGALCLLSIAFGLSGFRSVLRWLCGGEYDSILANFTLQYHDSYGEATVESMKAFRDRLHRAIFTFATLVGWVASFARCSRTTSLAPDPILQFFIWSILVLQAFALFAEPSPPARHTVGLNGGVNSIFLIWALALEKYATTWSWGRGTILDSSFIVAEIIVASLVCCVAILLPRRPDVFWNDGVVDRQFTTSFLKRVSFSWAWESWKPALRGYSLSIDSFAQLDPHCRSENLCEQLDDSDTPVQSARFIHMTLRTLYRQELFTQAGLAILSSAVSFAPQLALYGIVRTAELNMGENDTLTTFWICALGLGILISGALEGWSNWYSTVNLGLRIHKQLTLGVFKKLLRSSTSLLATSQAIETSPKTLPKAVPESTERTPSHNLVNLVAIDAQQVGMSVRLFNQLYDIPIKLSIAGMIIAQLLGWQSLLAAIGVILVFIPFSIFTAKRSSKSQSILMVKRDRRMALVSETMHGVRHVKFAGWETHMEHKILELRRQELEALWTVNKWNLAMQTVHLLGPLALSATTIVVHVAVTNSLKPSVAFASLSVLDSLEASIARIANLCANLISGSISAGRLQRFLKEPTKRHTPSFADKLIFDNATITWPGSVNGFTMPNLSFELSPYALTVLIGPTNSGKSLLLNAILGECDLLSGSVKRPYVPKHNQPISLDNWIVDGAMSYVAQSAWLENATIKQNILFGLPEDATRYQQVLFACALTQDLATFDEGDQTEVGPKQVNISGGQQMRISLARALYSRAGILVMDDIFSSVDVHTAHHLAIHALNGPIARGRTRILATHHFAICRRYTDHVVSIALDGSILTGQSGDFDVFGSRIQASVIQDQERNDEDEARPLSAASTSRSCLSGSDVSDLMDGITNDTPRGFVEKEKHLSNGSHFMILLRYFRQMGGLWYVLALFSMFLMYIGAVMGRAWWVKHWTGNSENESVKHVAWYLLIYITITGVASIAGVLKNYLMLLLPLRASQKLFSKLIRSLIHSRIDFLDRTPIGRIINRLSSDMAVVDVMIADFLGGAILGTLEFASIIVAASAVSPAILVVSAVMLLLCFHGAKQFSIVGRHLKQLESISRSPVFEQLNSITDGLVTIRAFGHVGKYQQAVYSKVDDNTRALWNLWLMNCWLGFRMALIGSLFVTSSSFIVVHISKATVAQIGFALSFAIRYTQVVLTVIRNYIQVELSLNAVDRVFEYSDLPSEEYGGREVAASWPQEGHLRVADLVVRYASHLPPALNGITFEVRPNQRIGVVGRTGAGKSSLAMALFRFLEAEQGCISLDGLDLSSVPLQDIRQRMAFISQEPYLFSGTIRSNLDPMEKCSDSELLHALAHVHWGKAESREEADSVSDTSSSTLCSGNASPNFESVLDFHVSQRGQNLSAGQRQQLCLARAIAARPKILVMDEATSAIDKQTDDLIQRSIRDAFGRNCTSLLVIAHRISTVLDFDRILVLDHGKIVEFGAPNELLERQDGYFRSLVERSET